MKLRIRRISATRASWILAGVYALLITIVGVGEMVWDLFRKDQRFSGMGMMAFTMPLMIVCISYLVIMGFCLLYNLVAKWTGGIEVDVDQV